MALESPWTVFYRDPGAPATLHTVVRCETPADVIRWWRALSDDKLLKGTWYLFREGWRPDVEVAHTAQMTKKLRTPEARAAFFALVALAVREELVSPDPSRVFGLKLNANAHNSSVATIRTTTKITPRAVSGEAEAFLRDDGPQFAIRVCDRALWSGGGDGGGASGAGAGAGAWKPAARGRR